MNNLKSKFKDCFRKVADLVNLTDPIGLISGGAPKDEYNEEIFKILAAIRGDNDIKSITTKIYLIFVESFDKKSAGNINNYKKIAEKILDLKSKGKLLN